jgi:photosystem II stability/assembly factor-like uncharacterized protein
MMPSGRTIAGITSGFAVLALLCAGAVASAMAAGPSLIEVGASDARARLADLAAARNEGSLELVGRGEDVVFFYAQAPALAALADRGVPYSVLREDAEDVELYLVPKSSLVNRNAVEQTGTIIFEDGSFYLVATAVEGGEAVYGLPAKQRLVSPAEPGLPLETLRPAEAPRFAPQAYSSTIQSIVDLVSQTNLYNQVAGLSGEVAVTVDGAPYTIDTRYSTTVDCRQAAEYLREQFEALGLDAEYDYFNFRKVLYGVDFPVDDSEGWAVGGSVILHTSDQGAVWSKQEDGTSATLTGIYMMDELLGWVVGTDGTILMTEDGATWSALSSPTSNELDAISFGDQTTGYICGTSGTILKSSDGGHTWTKLTSGTTTDLSGIWFVSSTEGWVVGDAGLIRKTTNGGASWQTLTAPVAADLTDITFTGPTRGFITGLAGNLFATTDGSTWQKRSLPVNDPLYGVAFADSAHGWACGDGGAVIRTTDGGVTWTDVSAYLAFEFKDIFFVDQNQGWVMGSATVQHSVDGGITWTDQHDNLQAGDVNVVATLPGTTHPEEIYIICGHYDDTSQRYATDAPGADDNATGTIAALEAARVLKDTDFEATLKFVCFSREEQGLVGSAAYVSEAYGHGDSIVGALNFDMVGYVDVTPEDIDVIYDGTSEWLADAYEAAAGLYVPDLPTITKLMPGLSASDHASFWNYGYSATCNIEDSNISNPYYHRTTDRISTLNFTFFTNVVKAAVATLAELARVDSVTASVPGAELALDLKVAPNPGRGEISIRMAAPAGVAGRVMVYDVSGRLVRSITPSVDGGVAEAVWRGDDASGSAVSPGIYFFKPEGTDRATKVVLLK